MRPRSLSAPTGAQRFIEQFALVFETDGMPRIAGRLFGLLLVSAAPKSLDELATALRVSKASVSINIRLLEEKGVVERIGRQADRRDYYQISDDILERMLEQRIAKIRRVQQIIADARNQRDLDSAVRHRLEDLDHAHNHMLIATGRTLDEWRARKPRRASQTDRSR